MSARLAAVTFLLFGCVACGSDSDNSTREKIPDPAAVPTRNPPAPSREPRPLNLVLITLDTTRADALGTYGQALESSPRVDQLAREGVVFERAITSNPETLPSHATLFTGQFPFTHGVRSNSGYVLPAQSLTLAEVLSEAGYATAAEVAALVMNAGTQIGQGFARYRDPDSPGIERKKVIYTGQPEVELPIRTGADISRHGIDFIRENQRRPFFLWLHYFDPHVPYSAPPTFNAKIPSSPYHAEIASADEQIGRVIDEIERRGLRDQTLVILTSDHGEGLGEHGELTHSYFVYQSTMHVPLVFSGPKSLKQGTRVESLVRTADIAPTVLDMFGLSVPEAMQGVSLLPLLSGEKPGEPRIAYGESIEFAKVFATSPLRFLIEGRWKYIHKPNPELYDLAADPGELENRVADEPEVVTKLMTRLEQVLADAGPVGSDAHARVDDATRARLEALGYLVGPVDRALEAGIDSLDVEGRDPNGMIGDVETMGRVNAFLRREAYGRALPLLESLRERNPQSGHLLSLHAKLLVDLDRKPEAVSLFRQSLERDPHSLEARQTLAHLLEETGQRTEAIRVLVSTLDLGQCQDSVWSSLNSWLAKEQRYRERVAVLRRASEACPDSTDTLNNYAWALATSPDPEARDGSLAVETARQALERLGRLEPAYLDTLASALAEVGDWPAAERVEMQAIGLLEQAGAPAHVRAGFLANLERIRARQPTRDPG